MPFHFLQTKGGQFTVINSTNYRWMLSTLSLKVDRKCVKKGPLLKGDPLMNTETRCSHCWSFKNITIKLAALILNFKVAVFGLELELFESMNCHFLQTKGGQFTVSNSTNFRWMLSTLSLKVDRKCVKKGLLLQGDPLMNTETGCSHWWSLKNITTKLAALVLNFKVAVSGLEL